VDCHGLLHAVKTLPAALCRGAISEKTAQSLKRSSRSIIRQRSHLSKVRPGADNQGRRGGRLYERRPSLRPFASLKDPLNAAVATLAGLGSAGMACRRCAPRG